jgi:uncharacterized protein (DUF305 family)
MVLQSCAFDVALYHAYRVIIVFTPSKPFSVLSLLKCAILNFKLPSSSSNVPITALSRAGMPHASGNNDRTGPDDIPTNGNTDIELVGERTGRVATTGRYSNYGHESPNEHIPVVRYLSQMQLETTAQSQVQPYPPMIFHYAPTDHRVYHQHYYGGNEELHRQIRKLEATLKERDASIAALKQDLRKAQKETKDAMTGWRTCWYYQKEEGERLQSGLGGKDAIIESCWDMLTEAHNETLEALKAKAAMEKQKADEEMAALRRDRERERGIKGRDQRGGVERKSKAIRTMYQARAEKYDTGLIGF